MLDRLAVTPAQYRRVAYVTLGALTLIVLTGAAVRLTDSGLGCENWPKCGGTPLPPLSSHALIEFGNRAVSGVVGLITRGRRGAGVHPPPVPAGSAILAALLLPLGVLAQAVLGGFTVLDHLAPDFVMAHFRLSMVILIAAFALAWRRTYEPGSRPRVQRTGWASGRYAAGAARGADDLRRHGRHRRRARTPAASRARWSIACTSRARTRSTGRSTSTQRSRRSSGWR